MSSDGSSIAAEAGAKVSPSSPAPKGLLGLSGPGALSLIGGLLAGGADVRLRAGGRSMRPFLAGDEVLTLRRVDPASLRPGALVLFKSAAGRPLVHRVFSVSRASGEMTAKGDALVMPDGPVAFDDYLGKVVSVEFPGGGRIDMLSPYWRARSRIAWAWGQIKYNAARIGGPARRQSISG